MLQNHISRMCLLDRWNVVSHYCCTCRLYCLQIGFVVDPLLEAIDQEEVGLLGEVVVEVVVETFGVVVEYYKAWGQQFMFLK